VQNPMNHNTPSTHEPVELFRPYKYAVTAGRDSVMRYQRN
jgi:hypothetical protein